MENSSTPLAFLIKTMQLTAKEIAKSIQMDKTLLSRWRTGKREINRENRFFEPLLSYLITYDSHQGVGILKTVLLKYDTRLKLNSELQMRQVLGDFLCDPNALQKMDRDGQLVQVNQVQSRQQTFFGQEGFACAMERFWSVAHAASLEKEILICGFDDSHCEENGCCIIRKSVADLRRVADAGHNVIINLGALRAEKPLLIMLDLPDLMLRENIHFRYRRENHVAALEYAIAVVEKECVLICCRLQHSVEKCTTLVCNDEESVAFVTQLARDEMLHTESLSKTGSLSLLTKWMQNNMQDEQTREQYVSYRQYPMPTFRAMKPEILRDVLLENHVPEPYFTACMDMQRTAFSRQNGMHFYVIYDNEKLSEACENGGYYEYELSNICGKSVFVSAENLRKILLNMRERTVRSWYCQAVIPFSSLPETMRTMYLVAEEKYASVLWEPQQHKTRMGSRFQCVSDVFCQYYRYVWRNIPETRKTKKGCVDVVDKLLSKL